MGLFDTLSPGQGLFSPDLQKAAALQGLVGMGSAIGAASQPSPVPGVNPFAAAGVGGIRAYDDFLKNALGLSLVGETIKDKEIARKIAERREKMIGDLFGNNTPLPSAAAPQVMPGVAEAPGMPAGQPPMQLGGAPQPNAGPGGIYEDTPANRLKMILGLGIQDPSKIYNAPPLHEININGQKVKAQYINGRYVPIGGPEAPTGYAMTPEGALAPWAGGPQDPRTIRGNAYAKESGEAPFKGYPYTSRGGVAFPWAGGGPGNGAGGAPPMGGPAGSPGAPGPSMRPLPGGRGLMFSDPGALAKENKEKVEAGMLSDSDTLSQLGAINQRFKPEYQTFKFRGGMAWDALKEKINPALLSPQERAQLGEFQQYKSEASQFFSNTLKALSGAAVTEPEMKRATAWLPNPGTGIFDGDSPTVVKANVDRLTNFTQNAIAKKAYIRERGLSVDAVDVDQMPRIMNTYGRQMLEQYKAEGLSDEQAQTAATRAVALKFGLLAR